MKLKLTKISWKVGVVPAIVCGAGAYLLSRICFKQGCIEGADVALSVCDFGNAVKKAIDDLK